MRGKRALLGGGLASLMLSVVTAVAATPANALLEPIRPAQWHLNSWKIEEAWQLSKGDGITVAVIDSGVKADHPDLEGQVLPGPGQGDTNGHGTGMASNIAATGRGNGGTGAVGVAPSAKILSLKNGAGASTAKDDAAAIRVAADSPAQIISMSFAGGFNDDEAAAVQYALSRGKLLVAGAGNASEQVSPRSYPAAYPGVLGVGAYDQAGNAWSGETQGDWISLAAPGVDIVGACIGPTGYCKSSGTSDATSLTAGVAALVWSAHRDWTANQVIKVLIDSANKPQGAVPNNALGYGNVSPRKALQWTGDPGPADVNPLVGKRGDQPRAAAAPSGAPQQSAAPAPAGSPPPAAAPADKKGDGSNTTLIIGVAVGGVLVLAVVVGLFVRSRRRRQGPPSGPGAGSGPPSAYPAAPYQPQGPYPQQQPYGTPQPPPYANGAGPVPPLQGPPPPGFPDQFRR
ncbi:S8 family serine peptidase [Yinghuangia seranimata]|uniref:S8 family serine peptidase n=1 Tax=Yinghuangia seranimata TaxID=408067 RepID=UPI00248C225E|nr:S8 family serine peptidase [Yinghuangia seranimata]MDI2128188.1 S8 family serine peptidase [Yinghuangia seranimata]